MKLSKLLLLPTLCLPLMAAKCDPPQQASVGSGQKSTAATETSNAINVHAAWPAGDEVQNVALSENQQSSNYMLVIDVSGSMGHKCSGEHKITTAQKAASDFVDLIPANASIGLVRFGDQTGVVVPLGANQHVSVKQAIADLGTGGGTPMANGIAHGYQELLRSGNAQLGYGSYEIVVLGDGDPATGTANQVRSNLDYMVRNTPISVTTIGFCTELEDVMKREGVQYFPASNLDELSAAFGSVLAEAEVFTDAGF